MSKHSTLSILFLLSVVGVFLADILIAPGTAKPAVIYAIPVILAAWALPPKRVAVIAVFSGVAEFVATWLHQTPAWLFALYMLAITAFAFLAVATAVRLRREAALRAESEAARDMAETRGQRLQEALRELSSANQRADYEHSRWQAVVEGMLDPVALCDATGSVTYINPAYSRHIGYLVPEGLPLEEHPHYYQLYRPDGTPFEPEELPLQRAALRAEEIRDVEIIERTADGREFVAIFNASPLYGAGGEIAGAVAVGRDITERKAADLERRRLLDEIKEQAAQLQATNEELQSQSEELKVQNEELQSQSEEFRRLDTERDAIIDSMADGLVVYDAAGNIVRMNRTAQRILGYSPGAIPGSLGERIAMLRVETSEGKPFPPEEVPAVRALRGENPPGVVMLWHLRNGETIWVSVSAAPIRSPEGAFLGAVNSFTDITELHRLQEEEARLREQAQAQNEELQSQSEELAVQNEELQSQGKELRESEERLRTMADAIPQLAWMAHADGFIYWYNRRWYEYTGTTPEQMEGWGWQGVHDPAMLPSVLERWQGSIATGEPFEMDFPLRGADGRFRWFLTRVAPMKDSEGRVLHWFGTNTNISERKEAETERERLLASEREERSLAENSVKVRDEFISVAAHELKTPVTSLQGFALVVRRELGKNGAADPHRLSRALERIEQQSRRLARLTDQLLNLSRLQSGKLSLDWEECDLSALVEGMVAWVYQMNPARTIRVQSEGSCQALVDRGRMEQVITNLLENAAKFSPPDSSIEIDLDGNDPHWVKLSVRDHGIGVPEGEEERIFERFHQAHPDRHAGGMGIGLYVVKQIVEMHGGTITLEEPPGEGSLFVASIPRGLGSVLLEGPPDQR